MRKVIHSFTRDLTGYFITEKNRLYSLYQLEGDKEILIKQSDDLLDILIKKSKL